jgi:formamidopyrimidine-DNA glycosylase
MPELPEVEIARENLERWLVGRRIARAQVADARMRGGQSRRRVEGALAGASVRAVSRRGKFLLFDLGAKRDKVVAHLGMTGRFVQQPLEEALPRFARATLDLGRGGRVVYCDARRFGQFRLLDRLEERRIQALGVEPLGPEFTPKTLLGITSVSPSPIKMLLMDQRRIAGVGNIQAAEALFVARLHPGRKSRSLDAAEVSRLVRSLRGTLLREIERYRSGSGAYFYEDGEADFSVYAREGEPCLRCRSPIAKFAQGGRSTYFCPRCQPRSPLSKSQRRSQQAAGSDKRAEPPRGERGQKADP